jgi:hypothetical protein
MNLAQGSLCFVICVIEVVWSKRSLQNKSYFCYKTWSVHGDYSLHYVASGEVVGTMKF